jgi:hypothetical protein
LAVDWFAQDVIYSRFLAFLFELCALASAHRDENWFGDVVLVQETDNLFARLVTVHEWHVMVHEDKFVVAESVLVFLNVLHDFIVCTLTVESLITDLCIDLNKIFQNNNKSFNVKLLVISNQDSLVIIEALIIIFDSF